MLKKIIAISNVADKYGHHYLANELDTFIKNAGIVDALFTLINPSLYGLDKDSKYLRRLQRGFLQGKLEKRLARAMAKLIEVGRYEKAIAEEAAPLKQFIDNVNNVYNNVFKSGVNPAEVKIQLNNLRSELRSAQREFSSSKLYKLVDKREKLAREAIQTMSELKLPEDMKKKLIELTGNPALLEQVAADLVKKKEEKKEEALLPMDLGGKKEEVKPEVKHEPKVEEVKPEIKQEVKPEVKQEPVVETPSSLPGEVPPAAPAVAKPPTKRKPKVQPGIFEGAKKSYLERNIERLEKLGKAKLI